jgi:predicted nucleic acid-binding protein
MKKSGIVTGFGNLVVTDLVLVETFHLVQKKNGCNNAMLFFSELTRDCDIKATSLDILRKAIDEKLRLRGHRSKEPSIGLADAASLVHMDNSNIRRIISFDAGFDRYPLYRRIHDSESVRDLRASLRP